MASDIFEEAREAINVKKHADYGDFLVSLHRIAVIWSAILNIQITEEDVCLCMIGLNLSRLTHQPGPRDSMVDVCGYVGLLDKVAEFRNKVSSDTKPSN